MTREELKMLLLKEPLSLDHDVIWRHDQAQREEIARLNEELASACATARAIGKIENERAVEVMKLREEIAQLREALERIKRETQVHSSYIALDVCTIAQAALAKEADRG